MKCRNCDWLAFWEIGTNEHIYLKNISSNNSSSVSSSFYRVMILVVVMTCVITSVNLDTHDYIGSATEPDRKCATQSNVLQQREPVYALSCFHLFHVTLVLRKTETHLSNLYPNISVKRPHGVVNDTLSVSKGSTW